MAEKVAFELVSPERILLAEEAEMVVVPGSDGDFGVLAGHVPLISTVRPGVISVYPTRGAATHRLFVAGGFADVTGGRCTVLAEAATPVSDLDRGAIDQEISDLNEDLGDAESAEERARVERALAVARAKRQATALA
jgi:F-type H+-transporting ATPase subunit epsilon